MNWRMQLCRPQGGVTNVFAVDQNHEQITPFSPSYDLYTCRHVFLGARSLDRTMGRRYERSIVRSCVGRKSEDEQERSFVKWQTDQREGYLPRRRQEDIVEGCQRRTLATVGKEAWDWRSEGRNLV